MKWGRRRSSSSSSSSSVSRPSLFSSWLSKLKKMGTNGPVPEPEPKHVHVNLNVNMKEKGRPSWSSMTSSANGSKGVVGSALYDEIRGPGLSFRSTREDEALRFKDMVLSVKVKEQKEEKKVMEMEMEMEIKTPRKGSVKEMKFRSNHRRVLEERLRKLDRGLEEEEEEDHVSGHETKQSSKIRVYSPRTPTKLEVCKIKALQDLKRVRLKKKAKETKVSESLAVVKCSSDPEKDFRDSMMEMILEESISKPEELEELLACYLTLNADEYHDLIIKVFRKVWLELNQTCKDCSYV